MSTSPPLTPVSTKSRYLPGLDGLRAIAVVAVVLYHADVRWLPGGFLGVDVFFVISGFLITRLLLAEVADSGSIDLVAFWKRRARRLLPALWTLLAGVSLWLLVVLPAEVGRIRGDLAAALTYVTNWFMVATGRSYFEQFGRPSPLRHLWSLAVEEQFYLVWPIVFGWLLRRRLGRRGTFWVLAAGIAVSTGLMAALFHPGGDPSRIYYGTDTRAAALLVGAAYAVWVRRPTKAAALRRRRRHIVDAAFLVSLGAFATIAASVHDRDAWLYRGGFLAVAIVSLAIVACVVHPEASWCVRAMSTPVLRWIGLRSYALYLWHWPVVVLTRPGVDLAWTGWPVLVLRLAITAVLAELSWRLVEDPVRRGVPARWWRERRLRPRQVVGVGLGAAVGVLGLATAVIAHTSRVDEITASIQAGQAALAEDAGTDGTVGEIPVPVSVASSVSAASSVLIKGPMTKRRSGAAAAGASRVGVLPNRRPNLNPNPNANPNANPNGAGPNPSSSASTTTAGPSASAPPLVSAPAAQATETTPGVTSTPLTSTPLTSTPLTSTPLTSTPLTSTTTPVTTTTAVPQRLIQYAIPSVAIGDSVMLGSVPALKKMFGRSLFVDAKVSRQFTAGLKIIESLRAKGRLGDVVIVHLGDNGPIGVKYFDRLLHDVADVPAVVIVAPKIPFAFETGMRDMLYRRTQPMANVRIADWTSLAAAHPGFLFTDNVHLRGPGALAYAQMLAETILRLCAPPDARDASKPTLLLQRCVARLPPEAATTTTAVTPPQRAIPHATTGVTPTIGVTPTTGVSTAVPPATTAGTPGSI